MYDWMNRWVESVERSHSLAFECAAKAVALDNTDSVAQRRLGVLLADRTDFEEAKIHIQRALDLNPNDANAFVAMGIFLIQAGKPDEAIDHIIRAMRLNPYYPARYPWKLGVAYYTAKRYSEAVTPLKEAINLSPKFMMPHRALAATYAQLGRVDEARAMVEQILAEEPHASLRKENWGNYKYPEDLEHWLDGMRKAGLPE
jgi:tetratricopeptide (TPR) repeat protein